MVSLSRQSERKWSPSHIHKNSANNLENSEENSTLQEGMQSGQLLSYRDLEQKNLLNHFQPPDPEKEPGYQCILFKVAEVICYVVKERIIHPRVPVPRAKGKNPYLNQNKDSGTEVCVTSGKVSLCSLRRGWRVEILTCQLLKGTHQGALPRL